MRQFTKCVCQLLLASAIPTVAAASFDENRPILCALQDVRECSEDYDCIQVTPAAVALPDFFEIALSRKQIASVGPVDQGSTPIERVERLQGNLILQGGDASGDNPRGGVGWTLTLNETDGKLVMAGVGNGFSLVAFGNCIQQ